MSFQTPRPPPQIPLTPSDRVSGQTSHDKDGPKQFRMPPRKSNGPSRDLEEKPRDFEKLQETQTPETPEKMEEQQGPQKMDEPREPQNMQELEPESQYVRISVAAHQARSKYSIYAAFFAWLTLAGYVVLPNTFTSLQASEAIDEKGEVVVKAVENIQLLPLAAILCLIGLSGTCSLWWKWRTNYIWLITRLFLPGVSHALIGLLTTTVSIITTQRGHVSITAKITITIISACGSFMLAMNILYKRLLDQLMTPRDKQLAHDGEPPKDA